jgi:uncharacterized heparinase superfamily protein
MADAKAHDVDDLEDHLRNLAYVIFAALRRRSASASPVSSEISSTRRISPEVEATMMQSGMILSRNPVTVLR